MSNALYAIVTGSSGVTTLLGTNPCRFFPGGDIPQGQAMPAATFQTIGGSPANTFEAAAPADEERVQIDCWSEPLKYDTAVSVFNAIRAAIETLSAQTTQGVGIQIVSFNGTDFDTETKRYRVSFDVSVWTPR